jgi:hypothetical protein
MKATSTNCDSADMLVGLANFKLETTALEVLIEAFEGSDDWRIDLVGHGRNRRFACGIDVLLCFGSRHRRLLTKPFG